MAEELKIEVGKYYYIAFSEYGDRIIYRAKCVGCATDHFKKPVFRIGFILRKLVCVSKDYIFCEVPRTEQQTLAKITKYLTNLLRAILNYTDNK
jgi:hypothetical protein